MKKLNVKAILAYVFGCGMLGTILFAADTQSDSWLVWSIAILCAISFLSLVFFGKLDDHVETIRKIAFYLFLIGSIFSVVYIIWIDHTIYLYWIVGCSCVLAAVIITQERGV